MKRPVLILYGVLCYLAFNVSFLYMAGFLQGLFVPKSINDGVSGTVGTAVAINLTLIFLFGFFHSLMARERFKRWWTSIVSVEAERSTFVLQASLFLGLAMWQWRPMPETIWLVEGMGAFAFYGIFVLGIAFVMISTFLIDHFELFGLRQVWYANVDRGMPAPEFRTPMLYRVVRHPMQLGVIMALFATPHMTVGHLLFAGSMTLYVLIGLYFEERSLVREFGDAYRDYQRRVPMLFPLPKSGARPAAAQQG